MGGGALSLSLRDPHAPSELARRRVTSCVTCSQHGLACEMSFSELFAFRPSTLMVEYTLPPGGGSLLLAWQLSGKRVLIVGGGDVSSGRIKSVLAADAYITLIAPRAGLHPLTAYYVSNSKRVTYYDRLFSGPGDLEGMDMVLTAIDDVETSRQICLMCREHKIPVNVADIPPMCDFYFGSQIRRGPLQILISTNGNGPKLASIIRTRIEESIPENVGRAIENVGTLRGKLKERAPGVGGDASKKRMRWMSDLCTTWSFDDLAELEEESMQSILAEGWEVGVVPQPSRKLAKVENATSSKEDMDTPCSTERTNWDFSHIGLSTFAGFFVGLALSVALLWNKGYYHAIA